MKIFKTVYVIRFITCVLTTFLFLSSYAQVPSPVACYNFSGNLDEANGGTPLTPVNGAGTFSPGGAVCAADSIYNWAIDQGLDLAIGNIFPKNNYTIEFLFKFTTSPYPRLWQRIVNFKNSTSDEGLYSYGSGVNYNLQMYTQNTVSSNMMVPNTWIHLFLTRDSLTGIMNAYINDSLQINFADNLSEGVFISDLILFKDDNVVSGEESAGSMDYLRIYDQPLTKAEISYIINIAQPVAVISGNLLICPGDSTLLTAGGATNYIWSTGATTSSISVRPDSSTHYSVIGWNNLFCTNSCMTYDTVMVTVNASVPVNAGPDTSVCYGSAVQLSTSAGSSYIWTPSTDLDDSTSANPVAFAFATTTYTVTVAKGNCAGTATVTITVLPDPPTPTIIQSHDTLYCSIDTSYTSYQWYADSILVPGGTIPILIVSSDGNYNVQVTNGSGCSIAVGINVLLNGFSPLVDGETKIYPNPASDRLIIYDVRLTGNVELEIYDALGEKVYSGESELVNNKSKISINVSSLVTGIYFIKLHNNEQSAIGRFVKE